MSPIHPVRRAFARAGWLLLGTLLVAQNASAQEAAIVALGDSNTAGYGVGAGQAFPAQLQDMLRQLGHDVRVVNAGVPGDTFGRMLARLDASVPAGVELVIVQGGYNDVLARTHPDSIVEMLRGILGRLAARRVSVVLCGFSSFPIGTRSGRRSRPPTGPPSSPAAPVTIRNTADPTASTCRPPDTRPSPPASPRWWTGCCSQARRRA
jgi:GDSL-like Lipase/Acylhydrolase family